MIPYCAGCLADDLAGLSIDYKYPRPEYMPPAVDPWFVHGSAPLNSCGQIGCSAYAMLAAISEIVSDVALRTGHMLSHTDVEIVSIRPRGELPAFWANADYGPEDEDAA